MDNHTLNKKKCEIIKRYIIAAHSHKNRSVFLPRFVEEKIIPKCTMKSNQLSHHIFPHDMQEFLEVSKTLLHRKATTLFHKAYQQSFELHKQYMFTDRISQNSYRMIKKKT